MQQSPTVSIVIATHARLARLQRCIGAIRQNVRVDHEAIVVGGAAGDGTEQWAEAQTDIRFIRETRREGATRAFNKGFRVATGEFVMWLNDDSFPLPGAVEAALEMIRRPELADVGMVGFYHNFDREWNRLDSVEHDGRTFSFYNVRGTPYANFGLLRRNLSLKVQREAGLLVVGCREALVDHEELIDERKSADMSVIAADNAALFAKWRLPERFSYPDPAPPYQAFLRERGLIKQPATCACGGGG
ncbi:MAG: glycosyltransferase family 2 protein [Planctomycetes bacterium]|nr:glycosyltransferase family 2 protein [Planctomycetota bacterium]